MNEFLNQVFFGNSLRDYLWAAVIILFVLLLNRFISKYIAILLYKLLHRRWKTLDKQSFIDLVISPLGSFLIITVCIITLSQLNFPPQFDVKLYKYKLSEVLLSIAIIIQLVAFIWLLMRIIDFIAMVLEIAANQTTTQSDNQLIVFFRDFLKVVLAILGVMMVLHFAFGFNVTTLFTGLSIVGAAIALALRESLENLIASFVIFFDKPFTTGDFVKVQNIAGNVERIGLRSTRIRTTDKSYVTVPNKQMVDSILDNVSLRSQMRGEVNLFLHLQTPQQKIADLQFAVSKYLSGIREVETHNEILNEIRFQSFVLLIEFFTPNLPQTQFTQLKHDLNFFILKTMEEMEIRVAG